MITEDKKGSSFRLGKEIVIPRLYISSPVGRISSVAQAVLKKRASGFSPKGLTSDTPEVIALRMLDYLSGKANHIRRKGQSFRTEQVYERIFPLFCQAVEENVPIKLNTVCMCTNLCSTELVGESPYPHMASYLGLENL